MAHHACTRLAPSPTGPLHLGNARTFILNWALARKLGWRIVFRHEDLDDDRVPEGGHERVEDALRWLGLDWDGEPLRQRDDLSPYQDAMRRLESQGLIFACHLSRREIRQAAGAPHESDHAPAYPPSLRPTDPAAWRFADKGINYRLKIEAGKEPIDDVVIGHRDIDPSLDSGDFVVWTRAGMPAYQLAVVVDDARQGVTDVVRGDDLVDSSARQRRIQGHLGLEAPRYWHLPLVYGADGRRLAKRNGGADLDSYRDAGVSPERVVGLLASWSGLVPEPTPLPASAIVEQISEDALVALARRESTVDGRRLFTEEDHAWLVSGD
ncbi:MAG: glutamate--tRNA ligase family protein [Phycisphaerales bacterium]|nr:glutamate--tRNA ligase family protein [Phycisphaerales bacterium]